MTDDSSRRYGVAVPRPDFSHALRRSLQSAVLEPPALSPDARAEFPVALALEDVVDDITELSFDVAATGQDPPAALVDAATQAILGVADPRDKPLRPNDIQGPLGRIIATIAAVER